MDCEEYTRAQGDGKQCGADACKDNEKLLIDGTCEQCEDYERRQGDGKECGSDKCYDT